MDRLEFFKQQRELYPELTEFKIETEPPMWVRMSDEVNIHKGVFFSKQGFGFEWDGTKYLSIPHTGQLFIEHGVEIFSGTNIVRPLVDDCYIREGTKIDYNCHIAHNVNIGKHCLIIAGTIIGGSVTIGDRCYLGIGCMIKNHVTIGNNVIIGMGAVVLEDVPDNAIMVGNPAKILKYNAYK